MQHQKKLLLGAHMSIEGGLHKAIERGIETGCTTLQIFTKSNRQWHAKAISSEEIEKFKQAVTASGINPIVAHASYLINLASPEEATRKKSIIALKKELEVCSQLNIPYLVLHPGSHVNQTTKEGVALISQGLDQALQESPGTTIIALETMAGQGSSVGSTFEELAEIYQLSEHKKRLGVCLDTCHIFSAGYDFTEKKVYEAMWSEFDKTIGLKRLKVIHVNDSKKELGSRVDRHETITKGKIGAEAFALLFNDARFFDVPKILETPKATLAEDIYNMEIIKGLLTKETKELLKVKSEKAA
ncbi:MAG: deoxyribonuclease IV [Candidatus Babeliales bacterium]|jgi:deoxyribonuclease-4